MVINLDNKIALKRSIDEPGLQIADVVASCITYTAKNASSNNQVKKWKEKIFLEPTMSCAVGADIKRFSDKQERFLHANILLDFLERSRNGQSLVENLPEMINFYKFHSKQLI